MTVLTAGGMALMRRHVRVEVVAGTRITRTHHGASIPQVSAKPFNSNNKECRRRNTRGDRKGGGEGGRGGRVRGRQLVLSFLPCSLKISTPESSIVLFFFSPPKLDRLFPLKEVTPSPDRR